LGGDPPQALKPLVPIPTLPLPTLR